MFAIKNALEEILKKGRPLDEVLETLNKDEQAILCKSIEMIKSKAGTENLSFSGNGQWNLNKNTLDYSKFNKPKGETGKEKTLNYKDINKPKAKPASEPLDYGKMKQPASASKPWAGASAKRDAVRAKHQAWVDSGSPGAGETDDKNALQAIKDRQTKKSEDGKVDAIKEKYADNTPKDATPKDMKAKYSKPTPKSTDQKVADIKSEFKNKEKEKANKPFKTNIKMFKNK